MDAQNASQFSDTLAELSQKFSTAVGINSFGLTYFTRYLSVYKKFFNENYHLISTIEYEEASGLCKESIRDFLFSVVRGGSAGLLLYQLIQFSPWNFVAAFGVGSLLTSQSLYSHYVYRRRIDALSKISVDELEKRKIKLSTEVRPLLINVEDSVSASIKTTENGIASITDSISKEDPVTHKNLIFNKIAYTQNSKKLEFVTGTIVNLTQLVRLFAFALFIQTINNELLDDFFNPLSLFALTLLWGCEVFKNDSALYQEALTGSWTSMATRWQLEKHRERFSPKESANLFGSLFKRTARVLTSSAYDYDDEVLEVALKSQNLGL